MTLELQNKNTYSSGIYQRFNQSSDRDNFGLLKYIPGLPHLISGKQALKGWILLGCFISCIVSLILIDLVNLPLLVGQLIFLARKVVIPEINDLFNFSLSFKVFISSLIICLAYYLILENLKDIKKHFQRFEKDRKPVLFASSLGGTYLLNTILLGSILLYGLVFQFMPTKKEKTLELEFTSTQTPPEKIKTPQKTQRASEQNTVNSGKSNPNLPKESGKPAPEISTKKNFLQKIFNKPAPPTPQPQKQEAKPTPPTPQAKPAPPTPPQPPQPKQEQQPPKPRPTPYTPPSPPKPQPKTVSDNKPFLPVFKPKASQTSEDRQILASSDTQQNPAPVSSSQNSRQVANVSTASSSSSASNSSSSSSQASRQPVLPASRSGGFSSNAGGGNSNPNNNPNGPTTVAAKKNVDYGAFMQDLQRRIQAAWRPRSADNADEVKVFFTLQKNGRLVPGSLNTVKTSSPEAEAAARQAVLEASPGFRPLPDGSPNTITIEFTFTRTGTRFMGMKKY